MAFTNIIKKMKEEQEVLEDLQIHDNAQTKLSNMKLSSNERELIKIRERQRQELIRAALTKEHKRQQKEYLYKNVVSQPNIFRHKNIFANKDWRQFHNRQRGLAIPA